MRFRRMSLLAILLSATTACSRAPANPNARLQTGALAGSNVLLVTIDTLRADRVGAYSGGALTPTLDQLASRGIRFTQAHAHAPMTLPAHTSILTGLVPPTHGVHNNASTVLAPSTPTLASILHEAGYRTGAFVGAFVLDARFGLAHGFDVYDDRVGADTGPITFAYAERTADRVTQLAGDWILARGSGGEARGLATPQAGDSSPKSSAHRPWFCWVHLFDPHAPYRAPVQRVADPYDNEVAFTDAQLGMFLTRLHNAGQLDATIVVVLADHGESLGEHGESTHGLFAYEATLRIPMIIAGPSIGAATSGAPAAQADVLPTVLDLLRVDSPQNLDGRTLVPAIRGDGAPAARPIYFEALDAHLTRNWAPLTGVLVDDWKYIDLPDPELYDLAHDPGELRNRSQDDRDRLTALSRRLREWPEPLVAAGALRATIDQDAAARLRALGYTASRAVKTEGKRYTSADDPKHLLDVDRRYENALKATGSGRYEEAAGLLRSVISDRPDFTAAYLNLASVFIAAGQPLRAVELLEKAATSGIKTPELQARLGAAYLAAGMAKRAIAALDPVADASRPGGLEAMNTLGIALTQLGRLDDARGRLKAVLAQSPRSATTWNNLGLLELGAHRPAEAAAAFEHAVSADPSLAQAWQGLGAARAAVDPLGAIDAWRRAVALIPGDYDLLFNLAVLLREHGKAEEARPYVERFVREAPPAHYARDIAAFRVWLGSK